MAHKSLAAFALLLFAQAHLAAWGQASHPSGIPAQISQPAATAPAPARPVTVTSAPISASGGQSATPGTANPLPSTNTDCFGGSCDFQPPQISVATAAPAPAPWPWQERIAWGANLVLVVLAYAGILIALSTLRKIERQTRLGEAAAQAAAESAQAALLHAQAMVRAERPWILMSVRPAPSAENGFTVVATNRGRGPARITSTVDEIVSAVDEAHLSPTPVYQNEPVAPAAPSILLPGESTDLVSFSRADVERICETEERRARVEKWEEKIFLYGKVVYCDLAAPEDAPAHESSWFCWYIHGRQRSGMVMAGPPAYNRHT